MSIVEFRNDRIERFELEMNTLFPECEEEIRERKEHHRRKMVLHNCQSALWDFGWIYTS